ncbi:hypothetical protein [Variovorax sp. WDL1]|uniref:hypothetical protein n=1 Tax=Variovorax sp. WDL1 TaxID=207745 RepID=UPI001E34FB63|nr:hypothetical protein [Variovorax sp. WDL1]
MRDAMCALAQTPAARHPRSLESGRRFLRRKVANVHAARVQRNQMVHGRWGIEAHRHKVVNVIGLPSGTQQSIDYTLAELTAFNEELRALERELARLRENWPL